MNKEFLKWLEEQEYDWDIGYNGRMRTEGRIWMLKSNYPHFLFYNNRAPVSTNTGYKWQEIIDNYNTVKQK